MRSDFSGPGQPLLLVSLTCLMALVFEGSSAQRIPEGTLVRRGAMSPKDRPRVESFTVDSQVAGWEIVLVTRDPRLIDLDLFVYTSWSEGRRSRLCASEGIESIETCRIGRVPSGQFMVEIVASEGRDRSEYTLTIRPLRGAGIVGTHLVTEDATPLRTGAWTRAVLSGVAPQQYSSIAAWGLYEVRADALVDSRDWIFAATSADPSAPIVMMIFDSGGNEVSRSQATLQEPSQYQDVRVAGPVTDRLYALVASTGRASPTVQIGAFRANSPIPLPGGFDDAKKKTDQWFASGTEGRAYALQLDEGSTGIVALEGIGVQLLVADPSGGALPVKRSFGSAQQLAWIGRPLGQSTHVLTGLTTSRTIIAGVEARDTMRYQRSSEWILHIRSPHSRPNYLVQFGIDDVEQWEDAWTRAAASRSGLVDPRGMKVFELAPPPDFRRADMSQQAFRRNANAPPPSGFALLARLVGEEAGQLFDLAVCTQEGRVLDIGGSTIRWEWPADGGPLYLAIFTDPFSSTQQGGKFQVEITRSLMKSAN